MHLMDWINGLVVAITAAIVAAFSLLVRTVLTSEKKIELLEQEITQRNEYRVERDESLDAALFEIRTDIKRLIGKMNTDNRDGK